MAAAVSVAVAVAIAIAVYNEIRTYTFRGHVSNNGGYSPCVGEYVCRAAMFVQWQRFKCRTG